MKKLLIIFLILIAPVSLADALQLGLHTDLTWNTTSSYRAPIIAKDKSLNASITRNSFLWHLIEPVQGQRNWSVTDAVVNELVAVGMDNIFVILGSPSWANGASDFLYVPTDEVQFQYWLNQYKSFVTAAVTRYKGKVHKWELWNEQNEHFFWKPKPNIDQYARWYTEVRNIIKSIDPSAETALGGLAGLCCSGPDDYNGRTFLELLYQRSIFPDIVAIHPYDTDAPDIHIQWQNNFDDIALIRQVMLQYGQSSKPIWVTEWGWSTNVISLQTQADWLRKSLDMLLSQYTYVTVATWFLDYDRPPEYYYGLLTSTLEEKPSAAVFRDYATRLQTTTPPPIEPPPPPPPPPPPTTTKPSPPTNLRVVP